MQLFHLVLELAGVAAAHWDHAAVDVQLADDGHASFQLGSEGLGRAAAQAQETDQDVLLWVLVGQEGLPAAVGHVVPPDQLHLHSERSEDTAGRHVSMNVFRLWEVYLVRPDFVVDFLNANFSSPYVSALKRASHVQVTKVLVCSIFFSL